MKFKVHILIPVLLFLGVVLIYKTIYPAPRNWYDHYVYLANAFLAGRVDINNFPQFYHDMVLVSGKWYLPFGPVPALVLLPFLKLGVTITQQQMSILAGAAGISILYALLTKFTKPKNSLMICMFAAFGTSYFWASLVGTAWFYAHVVAFLVFGLSLLAHFKKKDFLSGVLFALAVMSRYPMLLGGVFFLLQLRHERKRLISFLLGLLPLIPVQTIYNYIRFGDILKTGYFEVYKEYADSGYPYTILQIINPEQRVFEYLDPRNIPLHLYTFFVMPPETVKGMLRPSPYGMGIMFTSPLLLMALRPPFKSKLEKNLILGALAIALIDFLHYMQGWVQFGYRFSLDFLLFLLIILAIRFKPTRLNMLLLTISVIVNVWGVLWAIKLGW